MLELVGEDRILWGSDDQHVDSTLEPPRLIRAAIAALGPARQAAVPGEKARKLFGLFLHRFCIVSSPPGPSALHPARRQAIPTLETAIGIMSFSAARWAFSIKVLMAIALTALADVLFFGRGFGATLGAFALALALAASIGHRAVWRDRRGLAALGVAVVFAGLQVESPSLIGLLLFLTALMVAVLSPRARPGDGAWPWAGRLLLAGMGAAINPLRDALWQRKILTRGRGARLWTLLPALVVPLAGGLLFLMLFALANPVIAQSLASIALPAFDGGRVVFWAFVLTLAWAVLRPRRLFAYRPGTATRLLAEESLLTRSILLSLTVFNLVFALQNGLDIAFLWSGARLPANLTLAQYAHRGAYTLIAVALLAGLFVLLALRPGSPTAARPAVRALVVLWIAQTVFLVACSIQRALLYIASYELTALRIAALAWMGLVAVGLVLIVWRLLRDRSAAWLIDANALAAALVLTAASIVDLDAVAAAWNVTHSREVGGPGVDLDTVYLGGMGDAALVSLARLQQRPLPLLLKATIALRRDQLQDDLTLRQANPRTWTWRGMRRLRAARALPGYLPPAARPLTPTPGR